MPYCSQCGAKLLSNAAFCSTCGTAVTGSGESQQSVRTEPVSPVMVVGMVSTALVEVFVGQNYGYFARQWVNMEQKKSAQSWNWAAFFLGFSWMAYRKMYKYSWIFIGAVFVETVFEMAFGFPEGLSWAINMGISALFGCFGNYWYKLHVEQKVGEIMSTSRSDQHVQLELARQGGTNVGAAVGFTLLLVVVGLLAVAAKE